VSPEGSVAHWISRLKAGEQNAAQPLFERYFRQMVRLARGWLQGMPSRSADAEDAALSAFATFCRGAERGQFPQVEDGDNLWPLLMTITARKAMGYKNRERRQKRGGGRVLGESAWPESPGSGEHDRGIEQVVGPEPTPEFAAQVAEECQRLLALLEDPTLRTVALLKMEGYTNDEIAARLGCVARTVDRKLRAIRVLWTGEEDTR
jgi:DNA-directed RNA polymerase specialized sigma24 family protein